MDIVMQRFRIELNNIISDYRERGIPAYLLSGIVAQEMLKLKEYELSEVVVDFIKLKEEKKNGQNIQQDKLAKSTE